MGRSGPAKANRTGIATANDRVMTRPEQAAAIVAALPVVGPCLDPAKGDGAFFDALPEPKEWCEIDQGRDFLAYSGPKVAWVITNPPYSIYDAFLAKCFEVADNVALLVPLSKVMKSIRIERMVAAYGGIRQVRMMGGGGDFGFPFGFLTGVVWYQRGYKGSVEVVSNLEAKE